LRVLHTLKNFTASSRSNRQIRNPDQNELAALRIAGFGACMITGYPHQGAGLFEVACDVVKERLARPVLSTIASLGGFPAPRAEKYLRKKLFGFDPDYIVIQLGATDAQCPIRAASRPTNRVTPCINSHSSVGTARYASSYHAQPARAFSPMRWRLASAIGHLRRIEPITPLPSYVAAILRMVEECRSEDIRPVVLSPFVYGSGYTTKKAAAYVDALRDLHRKSQDMIFVDCFGLLAATPKIRILQHDGFHLSPLGHDMVGQAVGKAIAEDFIKTGAGLQFIPLE
jgi:lysophospholipase L1-like esterase